MGGLLQASLCAFSTMQLGELLLYLPILSSLLEQQRFEFAKDFHRFFFQASQSRSTPWMTLHVGLIGVIGLLHVSCVGRGFLFPGRRRSPSPAAGRWWSLAALTAWVVMMGWAMQKVSVIESFWHVEPSAVPPLLHWIMWHGKVQLALESTAVALSALAWKASVAP